MPVDGPGEVRTVATMPDGLADARRGHPDGQWLAFTSRTRDPALRGQGRAAGSAPRKIETFFTRARRRGLDRRPAEHVYVVAADGTGAAAQPDARPVPARRRVVARRFVRRRHVGARHDAWDLDFVRRPLRRAARRRDPRVDQADRQLRGPVASPPTAHRIAFLGFDDPATYPAERQGRGRSPIEGGDHRGSPPTLDRTFAPDGRSDEPPVWLDDDTLLATAEDRGDTHLYRLDRRRVGGAGTAHDVADHACTRSTPPAGASRWPRRRSSTRPRSSRSTDPSPHVTTPWSRLGEVRRADAPTAPSEIDAWIMRPAGFDPAQTYPVLLNVHGGPFTQYGETFFDEAQMQAAAGFVVLMSNPRGGSGRDTAWGQAILGPKHPTVPGHRLGLASTSTTCSPCSTTRSRRYRFCDSDRVGMLGGSYGGYMATLLAGRHGDRFRAICSERAVNNMLLGGVVERHRHGLPRSSTARRTSTTPTSTPRMSPIRYVRDINVPLLIIHSENDLRCPITPGRGAVRRDAPARQGRHVLPLPRRGPRAVAQRLPVAPPDAGRDHPRLLHRADLMASAGARAIHSSMSRRAIEIGRRDHRQLVAPVPPGIGDLRGVERQLARLVAGAEPDHQAVRERPRLAPR